jgi:hypothetical protein
MKKPTAKKLFNFICERVGDLANNTGQLPFRPSRAGLRNEPAGRGKFLQHKVKSELRPRAERVGEVGQQFEALMASGEPDVVVLNNIEVLFLPELRVDLLAQLRHLARNRTIVVAWPGRWSAGTLIYAEPEHPEHFAGRTVEPVSVFTL